MQKMKKALAILLTLSMVLSYVPVPALAEGDTCAHHEHDETCGYVQQGVCSYSCEQCGQEESVCTGLSDCSADEHEATCAKKLADDQVAAEAAKLAAEQAAAEAAAKAAADQAAADAVEALIDELPSLEEIQAKPMEDQGVDYNQVYAAYDAYDKLTEEQKALLPPAEAVFKPYFDYFSSQTEAASAEGTYNGLTWKLYSSGTLEITGTGSMVLEALAAPWLEYKDQITSVVVGEGITTIGMYAFDCCKELKTVQLPDSVDTISYRAFYNCAKLETVNTTGTLSYIDQDAFTYCKSLKTIKLDNVYYIGEMAFYGCSTLNNITLYNGATKLGPSAFANCTSLASINIPTNIKKIESNVFWGCTNLASVQLHDGITVIGQGAFENCIKLSAFEMPSCLTHIYVHAFANTALENITIPMGVTSINEYAFYDCSELESVVIPSGVTTIGTNAFHECDALMDVYFGGTSDAWIALGATYSGTTTRTHFRVTDPADHWLLSTKDATCGEDGYHKETCACGHVRTEPIPATGNHDYSEEVVAEQYVASAATCKAKATYYKSCSVCGAAGNETFEIGELGTHILDENNQCSICGYIGGTCGQQLTWILNDEGTLTISGTGAMYEYSAAGEQPWYNYQDSIQTLIINEGATNIGSYAFTQCTKLASVTMPDTVAMIGNHAFYDCIALSSIKLSTELTKIGNSAFGYCKTLNSITIPDKVTSIGENAFNATASLEQVTLGSSIQTIGGWAFQSSSISSVIIPSTVTSISNFAFMNCTKLTTITFEGTPRTLGDSTFYNVTATAYYPAANNTWTSDKLDNYGGTITWKPYGEESSDTEISGTCGTNLAWTFNETTKTLTITGSGTMFDFDSEGDVPWAAYRTNITSVVLPDGLTRIGEMAFASHTALTSIKIPDSVTTIGKNAFSWCSNLSDVDLGDGCSLGESAFKDCPVSTLKLGASNSFGPNVFTSGALTSITISADSAKFSDAAFWNCINLKEVHFTGSAPQYIKDKDLMTDGSTASFRDVTFYYDCSKDGWTNNSNQYNAVDKTWAGYKLVAEKHMEVIDLAVPATCTQNGLTEGRHCSACSKIIIAQEIIPVAGHSFVDGKCTECGITGGTCGLKTVWTLDENGVLTIFGNGYMYSVGQEAPWYPLRANIKKAIVESGITTIGQSAFYDCKNLTDVILHDGIISVGKFAFKGCSNLTSIVLPDSITEIQSAAFYECSNLADINIPENVTSIGSSAFYKCAKLESINIPQGVTCIPSNSFDGCSSLDSITIPNSVTTIMDSAFSDCSGLKSIILPNSITEIYNYAFKGCSSLSSINLPPDITYIGERTFYGCNELADIIVPEDVAEIGDYAFCGCSNLNGVALPDTVTSIGKYAFAGSGLESIAIPASVTEIGEDAFDCDDLVRVDITDIEAWCGIEFATIASNPLYNPQKDSELYLNNVEVTDLVIPDTVTEIKKFAFADCESLQTVTIPATLTKIGEFAFEDCDNIRKVSISDLSKWFAIDFTSQSSNPLRYGAEIYLNGSKVDVLTIPDNVTSIGRAALIGSTLEEVIIPGNVTSIGADAFAFANVSSVKFLGDAPTFDNDSFNQCTTTVYYPKNNNTWDASINQNYGGTITWVAYSPCSGTCGENLTWTFNEATGTLTISGTGAMDPFGALGSEVWAAPWAAFKNEITAVVVEEGVTSIGHSAFLGYDKIVSVSLPKGLQTIAGKAFYQCAGLKEIVIPDTVTTLDFMAFSECSSLEKADIPGSIKNVGWGNFTRNTALKNVTLGEGIESTGEGVFSGCSALEKITIPKSFKYFGAVSFENCTSLTEIVFLGDPPSGGYPRIDGWTATAYYPAGNSTWTEEWFQNYTGNLIWKPYCSDGVHVYDREVATEEFFASAATCSAKATYYKSCEHGEKGTETFDYGELGTHILDENNQCSICRNIGGTCGENLTWTFEETTGTLRVTGVGDMAKLGLNSQYPWFPYRQQTKKIVIGEGITSIADHAFATYVDDTKMTTLILPSSLKSIEYNAFYGSAALKAVTLPKGLECIGGYAFGQCDSLQELVIPDSVTTVGSKAFVGCEKLTSISVGTGLKNLEDYVFDNIDGLATLTVDSGNPNFTAQDNVLYNKSMTELIAYPMDRKGSTFEVPVSVTKIHTSAFYANANVSKIIFTGAAPTLASDSFSRITAEVHYNAGQPGWDSVINKNYDGELLWVDAHTHQYNKNHQCECGAIGGKCGEELTWEFDPETKTLTISGNGKMNDYDGATPWDDYSEQIKAVVIGDGVTHIGDVAFYECTNLTSVSISDDVVSIGEHTFSYCNNLNSVILPEGLSIIGNGAFNGSGLTAVTIPDGVTAIENHTFLKCEKLTSVIIGSGVTSIGVTAFNDCINLENVTILGNIENIGQGAFYECSSLESISFQGSVASVDSSAFFGCASLTSITLPDGVKQIGDDVFENCSSMQSISLPADVTDIGDSAFSGCTSLSDVYFDGTSAEWANVKIGNNNDCLLNATMHFSAANNSCGANLNWSFDENTGILTISGTGPMQDFTLDGTWYGAKATDTPWRDIQHKILEVVIESGVTTVGRGAFAGMEQLIVVSLPDTLISIGDFAFHMNTSLKSLNIPNGVTYLGAYSLCCCPSLVTVTLPEGITKISTSLFDQTWPDRITVPASVTAVDSRAFSYSSGEIIFTGKAPTFAEDAFHGLTATVRYPKNDATWANIVTQNYGGTITWLEMESSGADPNIGSPTYTAASGTWGSNISWNLDANGLLTISGSGAMVSFTEDPSHLINTGVNYPWLVHSSGITGVVVEEGVTVLGQSAFSGLTFLASVVLPNSLTDMASGAFSNCVSLTDVTLGSGITSVGYGAFMGCTALEEISIPANVTKIGQQAFDGCVKLKNVTMTDGLTVIWKQAFRKCTSLTNIDFPESLASIGVSAFESCTGLSEVTLPANLCTMYKHVFYNCTNLKKLYFEGNYPDILPYALLNLTATAYYPEGNPTWTSDRLRNYGGDITWKSYPVSGNQDVLPVSGTWGNLTWEIDRNGTLTLSGTGEMIHYQDPNAPWDPTEPPIDGYPWHRYADKVTAVVVKEGVISLAEIAFHGMKNLKSVTLPDSLLTIGGAVFIFCPSLERITVPQQVSSIGKEIFLGSTNFHEISFMGNAPAFDPQTFYNVAATAFYPMDNTTWTEDVRQNYGGTITWMCGADGNDIILGAGELADYKFAWIDGVEYPITSDGTNVYVDLPDGVVATNMIIYSYHTGDANDVHTQYPVSMKIWMLTQNADGSYKATRIGELDDILQYSGTSIRITGNKGIRMITSVPRAKKEALTSSGLAGYSLVEYGTVLAQTSKMDGPLTLGQSYTRSNYAYKRGVADPVFAYSGNLVQYTNVLVGFNLDQCKEDIAMRPYMILENAEGKQMTIYGGIVYRSIGYVAYQNRGVFAPGSAAYHYVWEIIHHVYGNKYDTDYKG